MRAAPCQAMPFRATAASHAATWSPLCGAAVHAHALQEMEAVYRSVKKIAEEDEGGGLPGFARTVWPASALAHCVADLAAAWSIVGGRLQAQRPPRRCGTQVLSPAGRCR